MKLRYTGKKSESKDVWSYFFTPLDPVEWIAGQSIRLEIPRKTFGVSERRFTIASDPSEGYIQITTRLSGSRFKLLLHDLKPDTVINAYGVEGSFIWNEEPVDKIFVAGGIGITPFRAFIKSGISVTNITLIYGTADTPAVFESELSDVNSVLIRNRRITSDDITGVENWQNALIYLSGPEAMVRDLHRQLLAEHMNPNLIKADLFTGNL